MSRPVPFHPLLVAAFPALALWAQNLQEVPFGATTGPLVVSLGGTLVLFAVALATFHDARRAAIATSGVAFLLLVYGHAWNLLNRVIAEHWIMLAIWVALIGLVVYGTVRARRLPELTRVLNSLGVVLLITSLVPVASAAFADESAPVESAVPDAPEDVELRGEKRDIYYIVLDRYGRADSLQRHFGYDNSPFLGFLEEQGFDVAEESLANYPKTAHSLAASLNMRYLDYLVTDEGVAPWSGNWGPIYDLLRRHEVGRILTSNGYGYLHIGTWWEPTGTSAYADRTLRYGSSSEFSRVFEQSTVLPGIRALLGTGDESTRIMKRRATQYQFRQLEKLADAQQRPHPPRFVFAHLTIPHEPYVFHADCSLKTEAEELADSRTENFVGQVECANMRMREIITELLAGPDETHPIIILQADEGPHPVRYEAEEQSFRWDRATPEELKEKLRILNAYYLPGVGGTPLHPDITPVNSFRLVFDTYFGTDFGLLPDRAYVFRSGRDLYDFTDVTHILRSSDRPEESVG